MAKMPPDTSLLTSPPGGVGDTEIERAGSAAQVEFLPPSAATRRRLLAQPNVSMARWTLAVIAAVSWLAALVLFIVPLPALGTLRGNITAVLAVLGAASAVALGARPGRVGWVASAMLGCASAALVLATAALGGTVGAPGLGLLALFAALACLCGGAIAGVTISAIGALSLLAQHVLSRSALPGGIGLAGVLLGGSGDSRVDSWPLLVQLCVLGLGLACGLAFMRVETRHRQDADERERRFTGLLAIAVDAYWELDAQLRLVAVDNPRDPRIALLAAQFKGCTMWELPRFTCDPDVLDRLRADLEARIAFRDLPVQWQLSSGAQIHFSVSGEPRFDTRGHFRGFWGVARDVTVQMNAQAALHATETRYQELFSRIPTPLVLHRGDVVIDANPTALQLFGYDDLRAMIGRSVLEAHEGGDSRERARRRIEEIETMAPGEALPVMDFRLLNRKGRRIAARNTGVRVDTGDGPATLSIYVDDTERRRAEDAVRRSEAMLSHLVATSPDVITLTDLSTGRYAMVNATFEHFSGYRADEVIGKTSLELGIWHDPVQRENFVAVVRERGTAREVSCDFVSKDGRVLPLLVSGAVFAMERRSYLVINGRDISEQERQRLERAAILENASIGIAVTRNRHFVLSNPRFDQMFGWDIGSLAGQPGSVVWPDEQTYAEFGRTASARLAQGELVEFEHEAQRQDGSRFFARLLAKAVDPAHATVGGTIWIVDDITERREAAQALARARDQAEAANRAKSAFLANTSHELRTPLNGMLGLAQLARESDVEPAKRQHYLDQIVDNAQALAAIISDVLDLSKIEAGKLALESTAFDLPELLRTLRHTYAALTHGRELVLGVDIDGSLLEPGRSHVLGDALRVRQILSNFLTNAFKFTDRGHVRLVAQRTQGDSVRFEVRDSGPGIDEATQARLFRPFTQGDESTTRRFGGTGLGLSICRELALLMGGDVGVVSQLGAGACFWAEVPLPATAAPAHADASTHAHKDAPEAARQLAGLRVLLVEDNPVNMLIAATMLERWGTQVEQVEEGAQAVAAVARAQAQGRDFDAVLMDVQMPVMSGYEATRELRRNEAGARRLPIIALTAAALISEREEALAAGMDDFLTKPIDAERLKAALLRWTTRAD